jgi:hypothetical protein
VLTTAFWNCFPVTQINTALAYAQLARHLRFETGSSRAAALQHSDYAILQGLAVQKAGQLNPRQISMVLTSLAWMQCPAQEAGQDGCAASQTADQHAVTALPGAACASSNVDAGVNGSHSSSSGAVCLQQQQQVLLLDLLSQRVLSLLDAFEPEDTCHCLWALTKLGSLQEQLLAAVTEHGLTAGWLHMLTAKPLSSLLWVHAQAHLQRTQQQAQPQGSQQLHTVLQPCSTAGLQDTQDLHAHQMVAAVMQEVSQPGFLSTWTPQELSMLLWSCAVLGVPVKQQQPQQQSFDPQQDRQQQQASSSSVHRHNVLPAELPVAVLQEVCHLARQHVVQFTPQGVAMVCWSLSHLLTSSEAASEPSGELQQQQLHGSAPSALPQQLQQAVVALFDAFTAAAAVRLQYYKPQEVCNIYTACTRLQLLPAGLKQSVEGYVSSHAHLLGCRDVTELLLAAAQNPQWPWQQQAGRGQQQGMTGLGPVAVRALLHRTGQLLQELNSFQVAASAWACVRLAQLQDAAARTSSTTSKGGNISAGSSALQEECMDMASVLLAALGARSQQLAAGTDHSGAGSGAGSSLESLHGQDVAAAWSSMAAGVAVGIKQTVALTWALAAASDMPAAGAAMGPLQQQHRVLLATVLQQLQQGVQSCDSAALVQVLCVLGRLCPGVLNPVAGKHALEHVPACADMQRVLLEIRDTAVARLLPVVPQLTSADAVTAGWAAAKLYVLLRGAQDSRKILRQQPAVSSTSSAAAPAALLSEVLTQLHQRQQLATLSGQSVSSLLWSCRAVGWVPPAAVYLELLRSADARLLQLQQHQQVSVLQSVAAGIAAGSVNPQAADGGASPVHAALAQQLHRQTARLVSGLTEQLQMQLHQQASQLDWQLRNPAGPSAAAPTHGLAPQGLITLVAACGSLKILQGSQLLHQVVEVWQLLQQQGAVSANHSLLMLWHLADVLQDSPTKQWHTQVLQQQATQSAADRRGLLPWLLHHAVNALAADLAAYSPSRPQQGLAPQTLVLALRVFSKLRYQAPGQVLGPLMQQLQAALPVLAEPEIVSAVAAMAHLAVPAPHFTAAAVEKLARKQPPSETHPGADASLTVQQWALQQQKSDVYPAGRPANEALSLLWAVLASGAWAEQGDRGISRSTGRLLVKLAHKVSSMSEQQLLQKPELLLMQQQVWRMLRRLQQYSTVRKVLHYCGLSLPRKLLLPRQVNSMTQMLLPRSIGTHAAQQALLQLLFAGQQQQTAVLQQHLHVLQQSGQGLQPQQLHKLIQLLPAWLQYQLQRRAQQQLAQQFVRAQLAAGFAAAAAKLKVTPSGEVVLVLSLQQHRHFTQEQRTQQARWLKQLQRQHRRGHRQQPSDSQLGTVAASSGSCKGVAVVLEVPSDVSVNSGILLGRAVARDALLQAEGYHVMSLPMQDWLPDFVLRHQHSTQLQEYQDQPMRQQHVQKLIWKRLNKLRALRRRQVGQLMEALYHCRPACSSGSS